MVVGVMPVVAAAPARWTCACCPAVLVVPGLSHGGGGTVEGGGVRLLGLSHTQELSGLGLACGSADPVLLHGEGGARAGGGAKPTKNTNQHTHTQNKNATQNTTNCFRLSRF